MPGGDGTRLVRAVPYGPDAFGALAAVLEEVRRGDPLAPVDVAVPSAFAGATVRRRLAVPGLVGVRFSALPQLIESRAAPVLAAGGRRALTPPQRHAATRSVLLGAAGDLADAARQSAGTVDVVAGVFAELDAAEAGEPALASLAEEGGRPAELAVLYRLYLAATSGMARPREVVDAACSARGIAPLVVYLPRWLTAGERRFCRVLAGRGLLRVVLAFTGDADADADADAIWDALAPRVPLPRPSRTPEAQVEALPDAEEEVRYAVRRILAHLEAGESARADRTGIAYRAAVPYARLIAGQLAAAGLPHHAPRQRTLAQCVAGRALLGLLSLPGADWSRVAVLDLLRDVPVRDGGQDAHLPVTRWERVAREAGVTRGLGQWRERLERFAQRQRTDGDASEEQRERVAARARDARTLAAFVAGMAERVRAAATSPTWSGAVSAAASALEHYLGGPQAVASWGLRAGARDDPYVAARCEVERQAYEQVVSVMEGLSGLDTGHLPVSGEALREVLGQELSRSITEASGVGRGVLAGPVWDFAGADLDLLVVVGAAEGLYPPRGREHPLLPDDVRARAGLRTLGDRRRAERRDHLAALAAVPPAAAGATPAAVLTHPVADTRAERPAEPAPWLLELTSPRRRSRDQKAAGPASFAAAVCDRSLPAATGNDYDIAVIVPSAPAGPDHPLGHMLPALGRGLAAAADRAGGVFGPWTGALSPPLPGPVTARLNRPLSATSLQEYAGCPFRYFLSHVLGVRVTSEPDEERHDPRARGSAVHAVLEVLVREAIASGKPPGEPWTAAEHAHAQDLLAGQAERMAGEGKAGRPAVWAVHVARWRRQLRQMLLADGAYRAEVTARPLAVEHAFGKEGGRPPLTVALPGGRVELAGFADRIDRTSSGALVVIDYKTGKSVDYSAFPNEGASAGGDTDFTDQGRRLQLPLYALVARRDFGRPGTPVRAYYWFVDEGAARRGGAIDDAAERRFGEVLSVIAGGVRDGAFPARPGDYDPYFRSFGVCRNCEFDRVCGQERGELWERVRSSPRARAYAALAEPALEQP